MIRIKKIIAIGKYTDTEITIRTKSENLTREESVTAANEILDDVFEAVLKRHHAMDVKIV